jgi:uncharacterized protein
MNISSLWQETQQMLEGVDAPLCASEFHGHLVGRLVGGHEFGGGSGLRMVADLIGIPGSDLEPASSRWEQSLETILMQLRADNYAFQLALPGDEYSLEQRLGSLADWCGGFLNGVGCALSDAAARALLRDDDSLGDLVEISNLQAEADDSDENEALYVELVEYVRLAVLNLNENLSAVLDAGGDEPEAIH